MVRIRYDPSDLWPSSLHAAVWLMAVHHRRQGLIAVNYPARTFGIGRMCTVDEAKKLCPDRTWSLHL